MESEKYVHHLYNQDNIILIKEDDDYYGFKYYTEHKKHKNIIYLYKNENVNLKWAYCLECKKILSFNTSNISKHQNSLHKTYVEKIEDIHNKIIKFMIEVNAPSSIVQKKEFRELFPTFCKSRITYATQIDTIYDKTKQNIKNYLSAIESINIYVDEWTRFGLNFIGIFCSTIDRDILIACGIPNSLSRDSISISDYIMQQLAYYQITDKINFCSTDCAPNIVNAITNLNVEWNPCCCHVINKAVEKALNEIKILNVILKKVNTLSKSTKLKQYMISKKEDFLIIPSYSPTRWLSIGNILKRLVEKQQAILNFLNSRYNINNIEFNDIEWTTITILNSIVNGINIEMTKLESNNKTGFFYSILSIIDIMIRFGDELKSNGFNDAGEILHNYLLKKLLKCKNWTKNMFVAAHLNPNLSIDSVIPEELQTISEEAVAYILQKIPALNEIHQIIRPFGARMINVNENQYESFMKLPYSGDVDVYEFWESHKHDMPDLYKIAKKFYGLYPSSSIIERGFSMAKNVLEDKYGAINADNAEKRIFLYINNDFLPN